MTSTIKRFYLYLGCCLLLMLSVEAVLEYRHYRLGYNTPLFGRATSNITGNEHSKNSAGNTAHDFGPTGAFPFKSLVIEKFKGSNKRSIFIFPEA